MEVYIILTDTGTLFTKLIKKFTKQPLNHASISFTKELDTTYSFGRKRANNPFNGGFVKEDMNGKLFQRATCAIYSCSVSEIEYRQMKMVVEQFERHKHSYKYNFIGLFGVLLNKKIPRKRAFFCSEFVATILSNGGIDIKGKHPSVIKPNDLGDCEDFRLLYKGQLQPYLSQYCYHSAQEITHNTKEKRQICSLNSIFLKQTKTI
ncbi:hypothetical protein [Robertmurraya andreesenii]|uniref:Uncharacterized protein n=1 Tax=Anoxybacillus andreesenii TaxID=1325932 RepID=A0ABT9V4E2_9BACL|nr:hypothetical protein [Robertmurraya andreesenii]MDQ0155802.1 hypothetical protein [Robertmurraya andreesenii]